MSLLPPSLASLLDVLRKQPLEPVDTLRERVAHHVRAAAREESKGRQVDIGVARSISELCQGMLDRWERLSERDRRLVQAACLYFVESDDDDDDLDALGFDDDLAVAKWVATQLSEDPADVQD